MKRTLVLFLATALLLVTAHQLPAPIVEETTPTPATTPSSVRSKPRPKSTEPESDHNSKSVRSFQGTWTGTASITSKDNNSFTFKKTLLISDRSAVVVAEMTMTRPAGGTWNDLPVSINASPVHVKITSRSSDLKSNGSKLTINWGPPQFSDWFPKEIPSNVQQTFESNWTKEDAAHLSFTYTLNGNEMTGENAGVKTIYRRLK